MIKTKQFTKNAKIILVSIILGLISLGVFYKLENKAEQISLEKFEQLSQNKISNAYLHNDTLYFSVENKNYAILQNEAALNTLLQKTNIEKKEDFDYSLMFLAIMIIVFVYYIFYIKSLQAKSQNPQSPFNNILKPEFKYILKTKDTFSDVIGQNLAKNELKKLSSIFKNKVPCPHKGVLLTGDSGVGKTMLARALANECGVSFLYQSASSFNEIFVGLGARRVRELFMNARKFSPCIVFIDEIDALGKKRGSALANDSENTLNEFLTQMDGFSELNDVLIIAATNRADTLDEALLRRFDKKIHFNLPNFNDRCEFLKRIKNTFDFDIVKFAKITHNFSGASFKTLENENTLNPSKNSEDLLEKILNIKYGIQENQDLNDSEKQIQAIYQAGKITMAKICDARLIYADFFNFDFYFDNEKIKSLTQIKNEIKILFSGMLAQKILLDESFDSFLKDREKIQKLTDFYIKINLEELQDECLQFLNIYKDEITNTANALIKDGKIFF